MEALALCVALLSFSSISSAAGSSGGSKRQKSGSTAASDSIAIALTEAFAARSLLRGRCGTASAGAEEENAPMFDLPERLSSQHIALFLPQVCT